MLPEPFRNTSLDRRLSDLGLRARGVEALTGDVSPRRYWRLRLESKSAILAFYPESQAAICERFIATGRMLAQAGVRVPEVLAAGCDEGWMLLEDVGRETLYDRGPAPWADLLAFYLEAVEVIRRISGLDPEGVALVNPPLDGDLLGRELEQTWQLFLDPEGNLDSRTRRRLRQALREVCGHLSAAPKVPCHRDFMVRNLVPLAEGGLAVLDHQDLRLGPPFYDLASLLNDSLFPPPEIERQAAGRLLASEGSEIAYRRVAVQRTLKAVGTFAKFGSRRHLRLIPSTLAAGLRHLGRIPEGESLAPDLLRCWRELLPPGLLLD